MQGIAVPSLWTLQCRMSSKSCGMTSCQPWGQVNVSICAGHLAAAATCSNALLSVLRRRAASLALHCADCTCMLTHCGVPAECCIWPFYQTFNFARVPVQHQLLVCNLGSLLDSTFLCW